MVLLLIAKLKKKLLLTNSNLFKKKLNHLVLKLYLKECWHIYHGSKAREERDELAEKNKKQAAEIRKLKRELNKAKKSK